jgi:ABC-type multidrug transport system fused ATPase/permease subunit
MAAKASVVFTTRLRQALFDHIQQLSYRELDALGTDTLITRMTSDINQVQNGLNLALRLLLRSPFIVFGAMIMAFTIDVPSALVFAVAIPLLSVVVFGIMLLSIPLFSQAQTRLDQLLGMTRENLTGVRVIRAFCKEEQEIEEFDRRNALLTDMNERVGRLGRGVVAAARAAGKTTDQKHEREHKTDNSCFHCIYTPLLNYEWNPITNWRSFSSR